MTSSSMQEEIKRLIADNQLGAAADRLWQIAKAYDPAKEDEVVVLKREISDFQRKERLGVLSYNKECKIGNKLAFRILLISNSIQHLPIINPM